ncbi:MAG: hypothetical protein IIU32_02910, partial [Firmicutes bacterium]|nr:hypothetical protein [Bacillota bacterium]
INSSQKKLEAMHFGMRKSVLEYDDVMNIQRTITYEQRRKVIDGVDMHETFLKMIDRVADRQVNAFVVDDGISQAAEGSVLTQGHEYQARAGLGKDQAPFFRIGGPGEQGKLVLRDFYDVHEGQRGFHRIDRFIFTWPEGGAVVGIVTDQSAQILRGFDGLDHRGPGGLVRKAQGTEVKDLRRLQGPEGFLLRQHDVRSGLSVEGKGPFSLPVHTGDGEGGPYHWILYHPADVDTAALQGPHKKIAECVVSDLSDEGGPRAKLCRRCRKICRGSSGICVVDRDPPFAYPRLGQVYKGFAYGYHVEHRILLPRIESAVTPLLYIILPFAATPLVQNGRDL